MNRFLDLRLKIYKKEESKKDMQNNWNEDIEDA